MKCATAIKRSNVTKFLGSLPFWSMATIAPKLPSANMIYTLCVLRFSHHFPYCRPSKQTQRDSIASIVLVSIQFKQNTWQCSCNLSRITMFWNYKRVVTILFSKVFQRPFKLRQFTHTSGPPTARISLHRRVQTSDFYDTVPFFKTERPRQFDQHNQTLSALASNLTLKSNF